MPLKSFSCAERQASDQGWSTEPLTFGPVSLLVGRNATGKTRILSTLAELAEILAARRALPPHSAEWRVELADGESLAYQLNTEQSKVTGEEFRSGTKILLSRSANGHGRIYAEKLRQEIDFQSPAAHIAAVSRRDLLQHPFLEPLHAWAASVDYFSFGAPPSRGAAAASTGDILDRFQRGIAQGGSEFTERIRQDMTVLGYPLEGIRISHSSNAGDPVLLVKESRLRAPIPLTALSQGMLRSLGLVLFLNTTRSNSTPACLLIDDLGEGLDFDHSCQAIEWLLERARSSGFQLVFSTNDRFIMNKVPLEHWSILEQQGEITRVVNYFNSRQRFDDFKFTGLSNFDFFSMDFDGHHNEE